MAGKKKDDNPDPQVEADRARKRKHYHKKKKNDPGFLKQEAERKQRERLEEKRSTVKIKLPSPLANGDPQALLAYGTEAVGQLTAVGAKIMADVFENVASGGSSAYSATHGTHIAKSPPREKRNHEASTSSVEEGQVLSDGDAETVLDFEHGGVESDALPHETIKSQVPSFDENDPFKSCVHVLLEHLELAEHSSAVLGHSSVPTCMADLACLSYNNLVGIGMTPTQATLFLDCFNGSSLDVSEFMPPGVIHKEYSELSNACKYIEHKLEALGARRKSPFGDKFDQVKNNLTYKTKKYIKRLLPLRNKVAHHYTVGNYAAAATTRAEFFKLVKRINWLLDIAIKVYQEKKRKREEDDSSSSDDEAPPVKRRKSFSRSTHKGRRKSY